MTDMSEVSTPLADEPLYDVAVVGYGPTGATLANLLALRGLRVLVLEREADIYRLPRAIHFDGESMRVFQTVGIAEALEPKLLVAPGMQFVDAEGNMLIDWRRPKGLGPQGWHASYRFHQPELEEMLRQRLQQYENVDVRLRHEVFAIDSLADAVVLRFEDMSTGRLRRARARYVVGCDGARSLVRRLLGTELDDMKSHERWLVVDVILKPDHRTNLTDYAVQYCDPARPATYVCGAGDRRRWEFMLMPHEDATVMSRPEKIWEMLSRWVTPDDAILERPAVYTFHSVVAKGWRDGRLLIAGDAAHQTPPFMGQGMCAGIRDAANLAWKLAEVVQGSAPESLLDTYESERSPHVREFIETAVRLGSVIQTLDPEVARKRNEQMAANPEIIHTPQPRLGAGAFSGASGTGFVGMQPIKPDGIRFDDVAGYQFAFVTMPELAAEVQALAGDRYAIHIASDDRTREWLQQQGAKAALIRPDRYVAALATSQAELQHFKNPDYVAFAT